MVIKSRSVEIEGFGQIDINGTFDTDNAKIKIVGISFPRVQTTDGVFAPFNDTIWPCIRKRVKEKYQVDVVGFFNCNPDGFIDCRLYLNVGSRPEKVGEYTYYGMFMDSINKQIDIIQNVLVKFVKADNGMRQYLDLAHADDLTKKECSESIKKFLRSIGLRTEGDDNRAAREARKAAKEK